MNEIVSSWDFTKVSRHTWNEIQTLPLILHRLYSLAHTQLCSIISYSFLPHWVYSGQTTPAFFLLWNQTSFFLLMALGLVSPSVECSFSMAPWIWFLSGITVNYHILIRGLLWPSNLNSFPTAFHHSPLYCVHHSAHCYLITLTDIFVYLSQAIICELYTSRNMSVSYH